MGIKNIYRSLLNESGKLTVSNRFLLLGTIGLALFVFFFVMFEIRESDRELNQTLRNESYTLIESLNKLIENSITTNNEIEDLLLTRLKSVGAVVGELETVTKLNPVLLGRIASDFDMSYITVIDGKGRILVTNFSFSQGRYMPDSLIQELMPVMEGREDWLELGLMNDPVSREPIYMIAGRRANNDGCIITGFKNDKLLEFRKKIGIGKQIQDLGRNKDIVYIALQDEDGIYTASKGVREISSFATDGFLTRSVRLNYPRTRINYYDNRKVFEVVKPIVLDDGSRLLNRIGLSLENMQSIKSRAVNRALFIGAGIFVTGFFLLGFVLTRQRFAVLQEEHKRIRSYTGLVLENMADGVIAADRQLNITVINRAACEILGLQQNENEGRNYNDIFASDDLLLRNALETGLPVSFSEISYPPGNEKKALGISISLIKRTNGTIETLVLLIRDLTEQKQVQQQLERREKLSAMGELAGGVAHEIRNPLNAINIIAQRFEYEFVPADDTDEYYKLVKTVRSEVSRVNRIIRQFLDFARPARLSLQDAELGEVLDETISVIGSQARNQNINIIRDYAPGLYTRIDVEKMKQVFINLLQNSMEAMKQGGSIVCSAHREGDHVVAEIADNGDGIAPEIQSKIFNLYFTTKAHGTGLGLSIVHQIVTEHGGTISLESEPGKGTKFIINLPAGVKEKAARAETV